MFLGDAVQNSYPSLEYNWQAPSLYLGSPQSVTMKYLRNRCRYRHFEMYEEGLVKYVSVTCRTLSARGMQMSGERTTTKDQAICVQVSL